jgi:hypothetical protein
MMAFIPENCDFPSFVSENIPKSKALGINLLGGAGMFAVSIYMFFMGGYYGNLIAAVLTADADLDAYPFCCRRHNWIGGIFKSLTGSRPQVVMATNIVPLALVFTFLFLFT